MKRIVLIFMICFFSRQTFASLRPGIYFSLDNVYDKVHSGPPHLDYTNRLQSFITGIAIADGNPEERKYSISFDYTRYNFTYSSQDRLTHASDPDYFSPEDLDFHLMREKDSIGIARLSLMRYFNWTNSSMFTPYIAPGIGLSLVNGERVQTRFTVSPMASLGVSFRISKTIVLDVGSRISYIQIKKGLPDIDEHTNRHATHNFVNVSIYTGMIYAF
jgi:opacity protein-like surface antigen